MRVVLFDLDDTLFDQRHCSRAGLVAVQHAYPDSLQDSIDEVEATYRELLEQWHVKVLDGSVSTEQSRIERFRGLMSHGEAVATEAEVLAAASCYREAYNAEYRPVPGAIELLQRIKAECPIGVVTNHIVAEQVKKVARIGVEPLIDQLIVSEEVGVAKPGKKIFADALSRLGSTAQEAVMIGDSWSSDILGAAGMGIRAIWLNRYGTPCPDPRLATEIHSLEPVEKVADLILGRS